MSNYFAFVPKTEEEIRHIQNRLLLPDGVYPFIVREAKPMKSSAGNSMVQLRLECTAHDGYKHTVFDFLVATEEMLFKIKHFCETAGIEQEYAAGQFNPPDLVGKEGLARITIQRGKARKDKDGREDGSYYPDKNTVRDYIKRTDLKPSCSMNDDIAF